MHHQDRMRERLGMAKRVEKVDEAPVDASKLAVKAKKYAAGKEKAAAASGAKADLGSVLPQTEASRKQEADAAEKRLREKLRHGVDDNVSRGSSLSRGFAAASDRDTGVSHKTDELGFRVPLDGVDADAFAAFSTSHLSTLARRSMRWEKTGGLDGASRSRRFKRFARKGVPLNLRGDAWYTWSGASTLQRRQPDLYKSLLGAQLPEGASDNPHREQIMKDLHRT